MTIRTVLKKAVSLCLAVSLSVAFAITPGAVNFLNVFNDGVAIIPAGGHFGHPVLDKNGKVVIPADKYRFGSTFGGGGFHDNLAVVSFEAGGKYVGLGVIDTKANVVVKPGVYSDISDFSDGAAVVSNEYGRLGVINTKGKLVVPLGEYKSIRRFDSGVAVFKNKYDEFGVIDKAGKIIVKPGEYVSISDFVDGLSFAATKGGTGLTGVINNKGKLIFDGLRSSRAVINDGMIRAEDDIGAKTTKYLIDKNGKIVYETSSRDGYVNSYNDGVAVINEGYSSATKLYPHSIIDKTGKTVGSFQLKKNIGVSAKFNDGLLVTTYPEIAVIDKTGKFIVETGTYDTISDFRDGLAVCTKNKRVLAIDKTGKVVINPEKYDRIANIGDGVLLVESKDEKNVNRIGLVDKTGKLIVKLGTYDNIYDFNGGVAIVRKQKVEKNIYTEYYGVIDKTGKLAAPLVRF
ncbi:hypothetical protein FACS189499_02830 [Clostridia bacterium]|nr:hypothetical protein FACS189499_02830 [Clostridia bacterium]